MHIGTDNIRHLNYINEEQINVCIFEDDIKQLDYRNKIYIYFFFRLCKATRFWNKNERIFTDDIRQL